MLPVHIAARSGVWLPSPCFCLQEYCYDGFAFPPGWFWSGVEYSSVSMPFFHTSFLPKRFSLEDGFLTCLFAFLFSLGMGFLLAYSEHFHRGMNAAGSVRMSIIL